MAGAKMSPSSNRSQDAVGAAAEDRGVREFVLYLYGRLLAVQSELRHSANSSGKRHRLQRLEKDLKVSIASVCRIGKLRSGRAMLQSRIKAAQPASVERPARGYPSERRTRWIGFRRPGKHIPSQDSGAVGSTGPVSGETSPLHGGTRELMPRQTDRAGFPEFADDDFENVAWTGKIHAFDQSKMTFAMTLPSGDVVEDIPFSESQFETVLNASLGFRKGVRVRLEPLRLVTGQADLHSRRSAPTITLIDPLDITARVDELRQLKNGWFDGLGREFDPAQLDWVAQQFTNKYPAGLPLPYLFPTPEGCILAEWQPGRYSVSLEINLQTRCADWHLLDLISLADESDHFNLDSEDGWQAFVQRLLQAVES
ncbi:MAG TPA: hypothetical protein DC058_05255 [Planctomycetaceae bacterium]|jgi:hypothetical protein|nr:hypothetical protein [Planctomycetaceae bacterium]